MLSPTLTWSGRRLPSLVIRPSPTATTLPFWGLSLAVSGSTIPPAVVSLASSRSTTTRSPNGLRFIDRVSSKLSCDAYHPRQSPTAALTAEPRHQFGRRKRRFHAG